MNDGSRGALATLDDARERTLAIYGDLPDEVLSAWPDRDFSPLCWHLGHIAFTEAHWLLAKVGGDGELSVPHAGRYAQDGCAKAERNAGYERATLFGYLRQVRELVRERYASLDPAHPLMRDHYLAGFLANHENQHRETMAYVLGCHRERTAALPCEAPPLDDDGEPPKLELEGGVVSIGTDDPHAYDNERGVHELVLEPCLLDAHPVTAAAWRRFMAAGGYAREALWSDAGWAWRCANDVSAPKGWCAVGESFVRVRLDGTWALDGREPVVGISAHEAEAYARFVGGRLPSEVELEHAARRTGASPRVSALAQHGPMPVRPGESDLLGNVWEWTASAFAPYPGFAPHPYRGYSEPYFDGVHRVLRGGSFATDPAIARPTFRNWYVPGTRQIFAGLRVAYG